MTKKHFIALADALRDLRPDRGNRYSPRSLKTRLAGAHAQWVNTVHDLADFCSNQNPRFNRGRWIAYINGECGPNGGSV